MALDVASLAEEMLQASKTVFKGKWSKVKDYAESEFKKLAETLVLIEKLRISGQIGKAEAALQLQIQKNATRTVLLTLKGLGLLTVEEAINAALSVVKKAVNTAVGFRLV
jgi:alanine dehydrogenase